MKIYHIKPPNPPQLKIVQNMSLQDNHILQSEDIPSQLLQDHHTIPKEKKSKITPFDTSIPAQSANCPKSALSEPQPPEVAVIQNWPFPRPQHYP